MSDSGTNMPSPLDGYSSTWGGGGEAGGWVGAGAAGGVRELGTRRERCTGCSGRGHCELGGGGSTQPAWEPRRQLAAGNHSRPSAAKEQASAQARTRGSSMASLRAAKVSAAPGTVPDTMASPSPRTISQYTSPASPLVGLAVWMTKAYCRGGGGVKCRKERRGWEGGVVGGRGRGRGEDVRQHTPAAPFSAAVVRCARRVRQECPDNRLPLDSRCPALPPPPGAHLRGHHALAQHRHAHVVKGDADLGEGGRRVGRVGEQVAMWCVAGHEQPRGTCRPAADGAAGWPGLVRSRHVTQPLWVRPTPAPCAWTRRRARCTWRPTRP